MGHKVIAEICNFPEQVGEIDLLKTNWLPICVGGVQWYVAEVSNVNNTTGVETVPTKIYKQGANGAIVTIPPIGIAVGQEGYCTQEADKEFLYGCEVTPITIPAPAIIITTLGTTLNYTNLNWNTATTPASPSFIVEALVDWGDGLYDSIKAVNMGALISHTPSTVLPTGTYEGRVYLRTIDGLWLLHTDFTWNYNQTTNAVSGLAVTGNGIIAYRRVRNIVQVRDVVANTITYTNDSGVGTTIGAGNEFYIDCKVPSSTNNVDTPFLSNGISYNEITTVVTGENGSQNRITAALALSSTTVANPTFTGARDVTVYNSKNVTVAFEYTTTINGIMHRQNIPANGTWSNTLKRDAYTNEGTYVNGQIVAAYGAATAAGEININWTT
jgi:hypothetical protein